MPTRFLIFINKTQAKISQNKCLNDKNIRNTMSNHVIDDDLITKLKHYTRYIAAFQETIATPCL